MPDFSFGKPRSKWRSRRSFIVVVLLLASVGGAGGGYYFLVKRPADAKRQQVADGWAKFDKAARTLDDAGMRAALDALDGLNPGDAHVAKRREAIDTGSADPTDPSMCLVTMIRHLQGKRWAEAEREADKRLVHEANDWLCRSAKVAAAFARGDRPAATKLLDELPDPAGKQTPVSADGLLFALELHRNAGRDPVKLRRFLRDTIVDRIRLPSTDAEPPMLKVKFLKCYLAAFDPGETNPPALALAVADIGRQIETATTDASSTGDVPALVQLGQVCEDLFVAFDLLYRDKRISEEQWKGIRGEHHTRTRAVWRAVRERGEKEPMGYRGLALAWLRDGDRSKAIETVIEGLKACGDDPALYGLLTLLLQADNREGLAYDAAATAANRDPSNVTLQLIAAEAAVVANRYDLARDACRRVYAKVPNHPYAARLEARLCLRAGDFHKAMQVLMEKIGEAKLADDATAARWYVRSRLNAVGGGVEPFLKACEQAAAKAENPLLIASALHGILDARFDAEWAAVADRTADRLLARWPNSLDLLRVRAVALARAAESVPPRWSAVRLQPAITAYERLKLKVPEDMDTAAALTWLRLKGEGNPAAAAREAQVLILAHDNRQPLTPRQLEVLGAVYLSANKLDLAVQVLELAVRAEPTPCGRAHLAIAYLKRGRKADAARTLADLQRTRDGARSEQDDADYRTAFDALQREK